MKEVKNWCKLATCYQLGIGVPKNIEFSKKYSHIAWKKDQVIKDFVLWIQKNNILFKQICLEKNKKVISFYKKIVLKFIKKVEEVKNCLKQHVSLVTKF
jgi:hypothetical protein